MAQFTLKELFQIRELLGGLVEKDNPQYMGLYTKTITEIDELKQREIRATEEEALRRAQVPQLVPDFSKVKPGTLVLRSEHYRQEHRGLPHHDQIGMIVAMKIFKDDICGVVYWPDIHWEGGNHSSICHPLNVVLKDGTVLPNITMNANQQAESVPHHGLESN